MKRDTALATAVGAALSYVIIVGVTSSGRPAGPVTPNRPVAVEITFADTGRHLVITDARKVASVCKWLDTSFENPRSMFDMRLFSPPRNELTVHFLDGESSRLFFSGGDLRIAQLTDHDPEAQVTVGRRQDDKVVVQYEGTAYVAEEVPECFADASDEALATGDQQG